MRTETFSSASDVSVSTTSDPVTVDHHSPAGVVVTLVPEVPGDAEAERRIQGATVRQSGTQVVVDLTSPAGGSGRGDVSFNSRRRGGGGIFISGDASGTIVQSDGGETWINGRRVSGIQAGAVHGSTVIVNGTVVSGNVFGGGGAVRISISMPARGALSVRGTSGSLTQRGTAGDVNVGMQSGRVDLDTVAGYVRVKLTSGQVSVHSAERGGDLRATSGRIAVSVPDGGRPVRASATSGVIMRGGAVDLIHAEVTSGRIY